MNDRIRKCLLVFSRFRVSKRGLLLVSLVVLTAVALIDFFVLGLARRTFVFYAIGNGAVVEERMLAKGQASEGRAPTGSQDSRELDIARYVEEAFLGPISPNSVPLFPKETRLRSLLYRNGIVYVDLSEDAALPPQENAALPGGDVFTNMKTLYSGIRRNFSYVRDVRFFIDGKAAYAGRFR